ncbi:MAG: PcfJ domain-containing protein [Candidatus Latescibacteria bacterium]|jgi:hypothetical protein|nr:PcfJ domain-containing protein [Candidatus Latescibacterota bacterium]
MGKRQVGRKGGRHRGSTARANADLMSHIGSLGLKTVSAYQKWCRDQGLSGALNKSWQERRGERAIVSQDAAKREAEAEAIEHVKLLGLETVLEYQTWCRDQGLSDAVHKSPKQRQKELDLARRHEGEAALSQARHQSRRPEEAIRRIYRGESTGEGPGRPELEKVEAAFETVGEDRGSRKALLALLLHAEGHSDLLDAEPALARLGQQEGNTYIEGLGILAAHHHDWVRQAEDWQPPSHNSRRQFGSLSRHLLARYEVPVFMDSAWFRGEFEPARDQQEWFKHVGMGGNIRTADVPVCLTKRMAHLFLQAPDDSTVEEALRWGQILGLGGDELLVRAVNGTRLGESFDNEAFWSTVVHFLVNHPMLDPEQVGPIVDFIHNQKYVSQEVVGPDGAVESRDPPQPNFAVKGRSMDKLLRQVEAWHRRLARDNRVPFRHWEPSGHSGLDHEEQGEDGAEVHWTIEELLGTRELTAEGRGMHHCVASYANSCRRGNVSIWSMQASDDGGRAHRVMTIAVNNRGRTITQARGRHNALPSGKTPRGKQQAMEKTYRTRLRESRRILRLWREQEGLTLGFKALNVG